MYDIEKYYNARSVSEAAMLLMEHPEARIISGGSDVLIKIREGKMAGTSLVSIRDIEELKGIERKENGDIYIGAGTVFSHITANSVIRKYIPVLGEAVDQKFVISERLEETSVTVQSVLTVCQLFFLIIHFCILQMLREEELYQSGNFTLGRVVWIFIRAKC